MEQLISKDLSVIQGKTWICGKHNTRQPVGEECSLCEATKERDMTRAAGKVNAYIPRLNPKRRWG